MLRRTTTICKYLLKDKLLLIARLKSTKMQQERPAFSMAGNNKAKKDWNPNLYGKFSGVRKYLYYCSQ